MEDTKIAILIDAENISYRNAKQINEIMAEKGTIVISEVIADWTRIVSSRANAKYQNRERQIEGWRKEANTYSMTAFQQFSYVSGKNTSDIALTIRAMKILYQKPYITTFCIVSNDSDFTRLAQELRMNNKEVIGMGERKAIPEFVNAFTEFIYLGETLEDKDDLEVKSAESDKTAPELKKPETAKKDDADHSKKPVSAPPAVKKEASRQPQCPLEDEKLCTLKKIVSEAIEENGQAYYSLIANAMKKQFSDFVPRNYDCKTISQLMEKLMPFLPEFVIERQSMANNPNGTLFMLKRKPEKEKKPRPPQKNVAKSVDKR